MAEIKIYITVKITTEWPADLYKRKFFYTLNNLIDLGVAGC